MKAAELPCSQLPGVDVEHEVGEGALQFWRPVEVDGEACARDFGRAVEIENAEFGAEVQCALGSKSNAVGSPMRRSQFSSALASNGTDSCGRSDAG